MDRIIREIMLLRHEMVALRADISELKSSNLVRKSIVVEHTSLTISEAAKHLGLGNSTIRAMIKDGRLRAYKQSNGPARIPIQSINEL